ncbi:MULTISPECIES: hypothetical protein [Pseudomonas]|uniref:Uncharacterized protein n=2 Tax=Pseudomonadaceae TaxID=135621 RepID=A0A7Z0BMH9_9GAMM|nr:MULTISPECIES: hypothetical protein [Pseudomonas]MCW2293574.1 hypothetical protein [Pseudomonas sp. BIGb0408]NYH71855.1 hypothetical protein [Pseudomonas flavescens]
MAVSSRLSTIDPAFEKALDVMPVSERSLSVSKAVLWVAKDLGLDRQHMDMMIEQMQGSRLQALAQEFDERYFELQDLCDPDHLYCFAKARCYSAAAFLVEGDFYEAIYEAVSATNKPKKILAFLEHTE